MNHGVCRSALILSSVGVALCFSQVNVLTHHNDNNRTGANLNETTLNTGNVNPPLFGLLFTIPVDAQIYAQPLYMSNVTIKGGTHNVLYVATENNTIYALDAERPGASPLWQRKLGTPVNCDPNVVPDLSWENCADSLVPWANMFPLIGITATPVIDLSTKTMYVVNVAVVSNQQKHYLHAIDITSGAEKFNGPVEITATVPGTGDGGKTVTYNPIKQRLRPGLALTHGLVVFASASYSDVGPYHGWVFSYNASTLQRVGVWCDTPNGTKGGIWQSGGGLVTDTNGDIFLMSGNGTFDGKTNFGMSFVKLGTTSGLSLLDYFTPSNESSLSNRDVDLGGSGPMAIPGTKYLIGGGKEGVLYVLDTTNMGKFNSSKDQVVQEFQATVPVNGYDLHIHSGEVYWSSPAGRQIYLWAEADRLMAFLFNGSSFHTTPASTSAVFSPATGPLDCLDPDNFERGCMPGGFLSISADENKAGTGILWANTPYSGSAEGWTQPGILHAFDASNVATELWNSKQVPEDNFGYFAKFVPPTVANGKVYMATFSNQVAVYGLLPPSFALSASPAVAQASEGSKATFTVSVLPRGKFTGSVSLSVSGLPAGATANFMPSSLHSGNSTLTVTAGNSTLSGSYRLKITGQGTGVLSKQAFVTLDVGKGILVGSGDNSATAINLSAEGMSDWVHWGDTSLNRKSGVTAQLATYKVVGGGNPTIYTSDPRPMNWNEGTPTAAMTDDRKGVSIGGMGHGFSITAPADTTSRTLVVHAGGSSSGGTLKVHLSDGSAPDFTDITPNTSGRHDRNYTLTYQAASASQTLTVSWVVSSGTGNVTLAAAALSSSSNRSSNGYSYSRTISITHAQVPNTDRINFPMLFNSTDSLLKSTTHGGHVTNANGYDIIFTSDAAGTQKLNHEIEFYNGSTGQFIAWVQVPKVSHNTDTVIYLFYGNSGITTSQENKTGVWDSNYRGVWHLPNGTILTANDSTAHANNASSLNSATATLGKIDGASSLGAQTSAAISVPDASSLDITGTSMTLSAWINPAANTQSQFARIVAKEVAKNADPYVVYALYRAANSPQVIFQLSGGTPKSGALASGATLTAGVWTYVVGTYDGSNVRLYANGTQIASASTSISIGTSTRPLGIGYDTEYAQEGFVGTIDEVRISSIARSSDWITTEFNNQIKPSTFYSLGSEVFH
jgi:hypothetical protein